MKLIQITYCKCGISLFVEYQCKRFIKGLIIQRKNLQKNKRGINYGVNVSRENFKQAYCRRQA